MLDHRHDVRRRNRFPVTVGRLTLFTANVSSSGFCTEILRVLQPGAGVAGMIRAYGSEYAYSGRVVWSKPGDPKINLHGRMGMQFVSVAPELAALLDTLPMHRVEPARSASSVASAWDRVRT